MGEKEAGAKGINKPRIERTTTEVIHSKASDNRSCCSDTEWHVAIRKLKVKREYQVIQSFFAVCDAVKLASSAARGRHTSARI
jgi:hypothetical protein